jgi:hypothetical protein
VRLLRKMSPPAMAGDATNDWSVSVLVIASVPVRSPSRPSRIAKRQVDDAAHHEHRVVVLHRAWNRVEHEASRLPDLLPAFVVVSTNLAWAVDDDLLAPEVTDDERRRPVGAVAARRAPDLAAGAASSIARKPSPGVDGRRSAITLTPIGRDMAPTRVRESPRQSE